MAGEKDIAKDFFQKEKDDKVIRYRHLNKFVKKGEILFTGSSLMEQFPIQEIMLNHGMNKIIYNRGIGGYTIPEMLNALDEQAREILLGFIDYYYTDTELNEGYFFKYSFQKAGERMMEKQLSFRQMAIIAAVAVILVIGLVIVANIAKKRRIAVAKQKTLQAQEAAKQAKAVADQKNTDFKRQQYEDELETQYVAVACPNCGASGNKIRKTTVGYCAFCGTAIKVDENGNVNIISKDSTET